MDAKMAKTNPLDALVGLGEFIAYIARLIKVATQDTSANHDTMLSNFSKSNLDNNSQLISVPLMMDIYFALDDNKNEKPPALLKDGSDASDAAQALFEVHEENHADFSAHFDSLAALVRSEVEKDQATAKMLRSNGTDALQHLFDSVKKDLVTVSLQSKKADSNISIEMSPGYKSHMEALEQLVQHNPGTVFPFLAVDPRRMGILELVKQKVDKVHGPFFGIKIYPPLGYLPTHPNLVPIFDYCIAQDLPITVHCSPGGLSNFCTENVVVSTIPPYSSTCTGDKSIFYANPANWKPVLEKWPTLRINFAHFGGGQQLAEGKTEWMNTIIGFLKNPGYPNVFTDVSYFTTTGLMQEVLFIMQENNITDRVMFGTDFIMIMLDPKLGGLKNYFNQFVPFNLNLHVANAARFLGTVLP